MPKYRVREGAIIHDGKRYDEGAEIEISVETAAGKNVEPLEQEKRLNVRETVELIEACSTIAEIEGLVKDDDRKTVIEAAEKRRAAIEKELEEAGGKG